METLSLAELFWCLVVVGGITAEVMDRLARKRAEHAGRARDGSRTELGAASATGS
jgi:hypothetical protein